MILIFGSLCVLTQTESLFISWKVLFLGKFLPADFFCLHWIQKEVPLCGSGHLSSVPAKTTKGRATSGWPEHLTESHSQDSWLGCSNSNEILKKKKKADLRSSSHLPNQNDPEGEAPQCHQAAGQIHMEPQGGQCGTWPEPSGWPVTPLGARVWVLKVLLTPRGFEKIPWVLPLQFHPEPLS